METVKDNNSVRAVPSPLGESICSPTEIYKVFPNSKMSHSLDLREQLELLVLIAKSSLKALRLAKDLYL